MPIYEYRCSTCGFQKEYLQKLSDPLFSVCPECSKETFGKMLTAAGFHLKGGGWYATDFKNSGAAPAAKSADQSATAGKDESKTATTREGNSNGKSDGKSDRKSDRKSDKKTETQPVAVATPAAAASAVKAE